MFIVTAKLHKRLLLLGTAAAALIFCAAVGFSAGARAEAVATAAISAEQKVRTNADRIHFLETLGWQVREEPVSCQELLIPEEMDRQYTDYLALQAEQGFDLSRYTGKRVKRYTYEITNYPTGETGVQVNLLLYHHKIVGGEVLSPTVDGFLHGLSMPGN